ncbi:PKD domain-containing protein [Brumimicrobium sp.]|uniref:PKD domain-containing protein n=1 Tax=Brumimicrobium sp. TaxID=2029867 RepID=UPI003A947D15
MTNIEKTTLLSRILRKGNRTILALVVFLSLPLITFSQKDTTFWFAAPGASSGIGNSPISLNITSYADPASVTISLPANGSFTPITISLAANDHQSIDLTPFIAALVSPSGNNINNNGIKISATTLITASYEISSSGNKEIFGLKGKNALGTEFYTPFQKHWNNAVVGPAAFSSFDIVATEDNTTVLITPRAAITGHAQDVTFSITLNKGQTYSARNMNISASSTLSGSIVSSDKPVAVTLFEDGLENGACIDAIGEQMTNIQRLGTKFVVRKGTGTTDRIYVLAAENTTNLTINTSVITTASISWGEAHEIILTDDVAYIESNKPVYVYHVSSMGCELSSSLVPNVYCAGDDLASVYRSSGDDFGVILYTRTGNEGLFTVNGATGIINASDFTAVPGSGGALMVGQKFFTTGEIPLNSLTDIENTGDIFGLAILQGTVSTGFSYTYLTEYMSTPFANAGSDATVCANVGLPLNGTVGGGPAEGSWSSTGYGTFTNGLNDLNNEYVPSSLDAIISPIEIILTSSSALCPAQKDTFLLIVEDPPLVNASVDQTVCANNADVDLNGSVQGGSTTGEWTTFGSGTFTPDANTLNAVYTPSAADITNGSVKLMLTSTNNGNCLAEKDSIQITITAPPVVDILQDTVIVCANNSMVSLSGTVSGPTTTGVWSSTGDGIFNPNNVSLNTSYYPGVNDLSTPGTWAYLRSTSNGKCKYEQDSIYIEYTDAPDVEAGTNQLICTNDSLIPLNGSIVGGTSTGEWTGGMGTFSPSNTDLNAIYTPTASEISSGQIALTLTSTDNGSCNSENDVVQFIFVAPPYANFNTADNCLNENSSFDNFSLAGYGSITQSAWSFGDGNTSAQLNPTHTYTQDGQYDVELIITNSNGCTDTIQKNIEIFPLPTADFDYLATCNNNQRTVSFTDQSNSVDPINTWFYDFGGQGTINLPDYDFVFNNPGTYSVMHIVSTNHNCSDTIVKPIQITPPPKAGFTFNFTSGTNVGTTYNFIDTSLYSTGWDWTFGNGEASNLENPSTVYFENGTFPVVQYVYDDLGCFDSTIVWVSIDNVTQEIQKLIPNVISPNGDGYNDVWKLSFIELLYPEATVEIYNQWGQQIFMSQGYTEPWDGTYEGEDVPDGNYYYIINLNPNQEDQLFKGALLVLRKSK